jgi:aryl-alcohol dehydrogenase-like predicted oxidoreductase
LEWYREQNIKFEYVCLLLATAPLVRSEDINEGFNILLSSDKSFALPLCEYQYPIQRALILDSSKNLVPITPEKIKERSQDLDRAFYDAGQFIWGKEETFYELNKPMLSSSIAPLILPNNRVQDIDTLEDFLLAESKFLKVEKDKMIPKIIIGTANFGVDYGITNTKGKVNNFELNEIISAMKTIGIDKFDTAINYGDSQKVLGKSGLESFHIDTKLPSIPVDISEIDGWINNQIETALTDLSLDQINRVYFHDSMQLLNDDIASSAFASISKVKERGLIKEVGISIYDPMILDQLTNNIEFDAVQVPLNIFDRRIIDSGWLNKLSQKNINVISRSVFLQGLLLMDDVNRPKYFSQWNELFSSYDDWIQHINISRVEACLQFIFSISQIHGVIIGIDDANQLHEISNYLKPSVLDFPDYLISNDESLIDPNNWDE